MTTSTAARLLRQNGFRRGALGRRIDQVEGWTRLALVLAFLVVSLPVNYYVAGAVADAGAQQEAAQRSDRHQVTAQLLADAPDAVTGAATSTTRVPVGATWTEPDGSQHSGVVRAMPSARAGSVQLIWTDLDGTPVLPPVSHDDTVASIIGAVFLGTVLIGALMTGIGALAHHQFDRKRLQQWDSEWQNVEPGWNDTGGQW